MHYPRTSVYLGGFRVIETDRGRGIYPAMLRFICKDISSPATTVVAETALDNSASQRGLAKAGFKATGRLRTWVLAGLIVHWRLERSG